jgi:hypothetical protein
VTTVRIALACFCAVLAANGIGYCGSHEPVLTQVGQLRALAQHERLKSRPVSIRGTVIEASVFRFQRQAYPNVFIHDGEAGIYVEVSNSRFHLRPGDYVEVKGQTGDHDGTAVIREPTITVLGKRPLPKPKPATFRELASGHLFSQPLQLQGTVRYVYGEDNWVTIDLAMDGGTVEVLLADRSADRKPPELKHLVGATVRVDGVLAESLQEGRLRMYVSGSGREHISVQTPPNQTFSSPRMLTIAEIRKSGPADFGDQISLEAVVTWADARGIAVQDATGSLMVSARDKISDISAGDRVRVLGILTHSESETTLTYASISKLAKGAPIAAISIGAREVLDGRMHGRLVEVQGQLVTAIPNAGKLLLTFENAGVLFTTELANPSLFRDELPPGSI